MNPDQTLLRQVRQHPILLVFACLASALIVVTVHKASSDSGDGQRGIRQPLLVDTATVEMHPFSDTIAAIGTARAQESVELMSTVTETVRAVHFTDGMLVEKGDLLVELTSAEEKAFLAEANATLREASRQHVRIADLVRTGEMPESELDAQTAVLETAEARVERILARLDDHVIRAPFAGLLGFRGVSEGTLLSGTTVITTLDDISTILVDFSVPETYFGDLRVGQVVEAYGSAYPGHAFTGEVTSIRSRIDPATRAATVRAAVNNSDGKLHPGMLLSIELIRNRNETLAVPEEALVPIRNRQTVFVVDADFVVRQTDVTIGRRMRGVVEILAGLNEGEAVVTRGTIRVRDGGTVRVDEPAADLAYDAHAK